MQNAALTLVFIKPGHASTTGEADHDEAHCYYFSQIHFFLRLGFMLMRGIEAPSGSAFMHHIQDSLIACSTCSLQNM